MAKAKLIQKEPKVALTLTLTEAAILKALVQREDSEHLDDVWDELRGLDPNELGAPRVKIEGTVGKYTVVLS